MSHQLIFGLGIGQKGAEERASVMVDFKPVPESKAGETMGEFVIVLGRTPEAD